MLADTWSQLLFYVLIGLLLFIAPAVAKLSTEALTGYVFAALYMMTPTWALIATLPTFLRGRVSLAKIRELGASLDAVAPERVAVGREPLIRASRAHRARARDVFLSGAGRR